LLILLVDDISDTGKTLQAIDDMLREQYGVSRILAVCYAMNPRTEYFVIGAKYCGDRWVEFPWERKE